MTVNELTFRKSSHSSAQQNCVEVADLERDGRAIRDSKTPESGHLSFASAEWRAFLTAAKDDRL